ncbi:MAG: class I SAM-dependent methyltransferase [Candidatus Gracilibacteria bacterium]|nr:class I SAM-dependent methyltransferase [Candidatus Gracilibacteria bacterium]
MNNTCSCEGVKSNTDNKNASPTINTFLNSQRALAETFTLTAFFRSLVNYPFSKEVINYLLSVSGLSKEELQSRWDSFDRVFGEDYGRKISALSFSAIIEARGLLIDSILRQKVDKNTIILEVASGFSPRAVNLINNYGFNHTQYIETDKLEIIGLKKGFYNNLLDAKTPVLSSFNVINDDIGELEELILNLKEVNPDIYKLVILSEGLLIYLSPEEQRKYFGNLRKLKERLRLYGIEIEYISIDLPSHENFTDWLLHEGFSHEDHIQVMKNVDPKILECLHEKEESFFNNIGVDLDRVNKYYYQSGVLQHLETPKLDKYKSILGLDKKIEDFLRQKILFAYSIKL